MTHEEMAQLNEAVAKSFPHDGAIRIALQAGAAALRREQWKPIADAPKDRPVLGWFSATHQEGIYWEEPPDGYGWHFLSDGDAPTSGRALPKYYRELPAPPEAV